MGSDNLIIEGNCIDKSNKYRFDDACCRLYQKDIITSDKTNVSYKLDSSAANKIKLKFYNPVISSWQSTDYITTKEIFGDWYITKIDN